ncbi:AAA family ATPase [Shewanella algae]|uniref:AAA family ATPase n=1 Tax=Shewanella algae TaxID=38313 RepID=UPI00313E9903
MSFFAYRAAPFEFTHENKVFNRLYDLLYQAWGDRDDSLHLIGNVYVAGRPVDALVIKHNAIVVIDFKDYGGEITFSENGRWKADDAYVKGGSSVNPYQQIRNNKFSLLNYLEERVTFCSEPNLGHIAGLCLFHQDIHFDDKQLPSGISRWFHVADVAHSVRLLEALASPAINLAPLEIEHIIEILAVSRYYPDGHEIKETVNDELRKRGELNDISDCFQGVDLTEGQTKAITSIGVFLASDSFGGYILHGYAGTGKTFIARGIVDFVTRQGKHCILMAPTGKAAKVIAEKTNHHASTIHKAIYEYSNALDDDLEANVPVATIKPNNDDVDTVYIVDEASMLSDAFSNADNMQFGSGYLLQDLVMYVRDGGYETQRKIIFIGDDAQLPPVGMRNSPALDANYLREKYALPVAESTLNEVVRQKSGSGVMDNALMLRHALDTDTFNQLDFDTSKADVESLSSDVFVERYMALCERQISKTKEVVIVAYTNAQVDSYNRRCREIFFPNQSKLCAGDKVIAVANHYRNDVTVTNGEFGLVRRLLGESECRVVTFNNKSENGSIEKITVNLSFRDVEILFRDETGSPVSVTGKVVEHLLYNDKPALTADESKALYVDFLNRHPHLQRKGMREERKQALKDDPYFNAFKVKFGYAITCHKAQGSEWQHVLVNCYSAHQHTLSRDYFRWLYTAITRTSNKLYVLNEPKIRIGSDSTIVGDTSWMPEDEPVIALPGTVEIVPEGIDINLDSPLGYLYQKVKSVILGSGIKLTGVQHFPYRERYMFSAENQNAEVEFIYNGKNIVSQVNVRGTGLFLTMLKTLLSPIEGMVMPSYKQGHVENKFVFLDDYLEVFHKRVIEIFSAHEITVHELAQNQWVQRYTFAKNGETAVIDFHYNGKKQFNKVTPLVNLSSSKHLLSQIVRVWCDA